MASRARAPGFTLLYPDRKSRDGKYGIYGDFRTLRFFRRKRVCAERLFQVYRMTRKEVEEQRESGWDALSGWMVRIFRKRQVDGVSKEVADHEFFDTIAQLLRAKLPKKAMIFAMKEYTEPEINKLKEDRVLPKNW